VRGEEGTPRRGFILQRSLMGETGNEGEKVKDPLEKVYKALWDKRIGTGARGARFFFNTNRA